MVESFVGLSASTLALFGVALFGLGLWIIYKAYHDVPPAPDISKNPTPNQYK